MLQQTIDNRRSIDFIENKTNQFPLCILARRRVMQ